VHTIERTGPQDRLFEEIVFREGFTDRARLRGLAESLANNECGTYLMRVVEAG
jgi:hypothetical protein